MTYETRESARVESAVGTILEVTHGRASGCGVLLDESVKQTPRRFRKAWEQYTSGYGVDVTSLLSTFDSGGYDQLVIVRDIPFYSLCEHHLAPFFGTVTVAYLPSGRVVGLSKIARVVEAFARRLQIQERLTRDVAWALFGPDRELWASKDGESGWTYSKTHSLNPEGVAVHVRARHLCMESRGIQKPGAETVTSEMLGLFRENQSLREEFLAMGVGG